jgi:hypothetical protein
MAINTQNFLPLAKSSTAIVKHAGSQISTEKKDKGGAIIKQKKIDIQRFRPPEKQEEEKKEESYGAIVKSLITIDKFLKTNSSSEKKTFEKDRLEKEKEESQKKEKKLESKERGKGKGINLPSISLPKFDFLDAVKRYFLFTFLGWLFTNTQKFLPQLTKILDIIKPVVNAAEFIFKGLLNGFVTFIELGYNAYDKVRDTVKNLGGEGAQKVFDDLSKNLNTLITTTILVAGAIATLGEKSKPSGPKGGVPGSPRGGVPRGGPRRSPITGRPVPTTSGGRTAGRPDIRNPLRERPRITGSGGGRAGQIDIRNPLRQRPAITRSGGEGRFAGKGLGKFLSKGAPIIGPLIDFSIRTLIFGESPGRAAAGAIGAGVGQALGGVLVGTIGGIVGSVIPIAGTLLGGSAGAFVGQLIGGFVGDWIGTSLYDAVASMKDKKKIEKKETGGKVSPKTRVKGKKNSKRSIKVASKRHPKITPQVSQPGKDVGGEKNIKVLYPDPDKKMSLDEFLISEMGQGSYSYSQYENDFKKRTKKPNPFKALTATAKILKEIPLFGGTIGSIMGAGVDIALGQKPDKKVYQSIASGIGFLVDTLSDQRVNKSMGSLMSQIRGFAEGGTVPTRELKLGDDTTNTTKLLTKIIEPAISQKVNQAFQSIQKELQLKGKKEPGQPGGGQPGGGGPGGGGGPSVESIDMNGLSKEDVDALGRMVQAEAGNQSAAGKASVMNVILNRYRLAKAGKGYLPSGKTKDTVTIRDILYDPNQFSPIDDGRFDRTSSAAGRSALAQAISAGGNDPEKLKKVLMEKYNLNEQDANYVIVSTVFSNPEARGSRPFNTREVTVGDHTFQESPDARLRAPGQKIDATVKETPSLIIKGGPIKGGAIVTQRGDPDNEQTGSDIAVGNYQVGDQIQNPFQSLKITKIGFQGKGSGESGQGFGRYVTGETIINGKRYEILLGHLNKALVKEGDILEAGDVIGTQGISGHATGPHVSTHINALDGGDPSKVLSSVENVWTRGGAIETKSMGRPTSQSQPPKAPPGQTPGRTGTELAEEMELLQKPVVESFKVGSDTYTHRQGGVYTKNGKRINKDEFDKSKGSQGQGNWWSNLFGQNKPTPSAKVEGIINHNGQTYYRQGDKYFKKPGPGEDIIQIPKSIYDTVLRAETIQARGNLQGGGLIGKPKSKLPIPNKFASYENYGQQSMIAILPIQTEVMVPVPTDGGGPMMFPSANLNTKDSHKIHSLSRG